MEGSIMKTFLKIFLAIVIVIALAIGGLWFYITRGLDTGAKLDVGSIDLNKIEDGVYNGVYKSGRFSNEVKVTVKDHEITDIELVRDVTFSKPEITREVFDEIKEKQDINVDTVSGATVTSKAYLKAIENALAGGK